MYDDDVTRIPKNEDELWVVLREQFQFVRMVLWDTPVETREQATKKTSRHNAAFIIRYRGSSYEMEQLDWYLEMGRELLPYIHYSIDQKKLTPQFVQQWGKIMFCHGYVASYMLDDTDTTRHLRGGTAAGKKRSQDAQRKWLAQHMVPLIDSGMTRAEAQERVEKHIRNLIGSEPLPPGFEKKWLVGLMSHGELKATFDEKHLSIKTMCALCNEPGDDIPPVKSLVP